MSNTIKFVSGLMLPAYVFTAASVTDVCIGMNKCNPDMQLEMEAIVPVSASATYHFSDINSTVPIVLSITSATQFHQFESSGTLTFTTSS